MTEKTFDVTKLLRPKASAELIMKAPKHVTINESGVENASRIILDLFKSGKIHPQRFGQMELHPKKADEKAIDWIFMVDTLNFSFWCGNELDRSIPKWKVKFQKRSYTGYFGLCAAINRGILEYKMDLTDPRVYASMEEDEVLRIFRSETSCQIPMLSERIENLKEVSKVLVEKYNGSFVNCVKEANGNAQSLLNLIIQEFPCYRDDAIYNGHVVTFWKRAQILVGDIWACFEGKGLGYFSDIDSLTMFPDYRIPQVLLHFGVIHYSPELHQILQEGNIMENGSIEEMEIRAASIHAVELIKEKVNKDLLSSSTEGKEENKKTINSVLIDHFLWDYRREHSKQLLHLPFHKVRCIYY